MRKFLCKETGAILLVKNVFTIKQMLKSEVYEEIKEEEPAKKQKAIKDFNKAELMEHLTGLGIEFDEKMTNAELRALIPNED